MENRKFATVVGSLAVVAIILSALAISRTPEQIVRNEIVREVQTQLGGASGPDHTENQVFLNNVTNGGEVTSTTTVDTTITLDSRHLRNKTSLISMNVGINTTITTMASTSEPLVGLKPGQSFEVYFFNASTTAGSTATFAAGTGVDMQEDEGETVIVNGLEISKLTFLKKADSNVIFWVEAGQVAD